MSLDEVVEPKDPRKMDVDLDNEYRSRTIRQSVFALPAKYRDGAFVVFHGSWNRAPLPQQGFKVVFQPMSQGRAVYSMQFSRYETLPQAVAEEIVAKVKG